MDVPQFWKHNVRDSLKKILSARLMRQRFLLLINLCIHYFSFISLISFWIFTNEKYTCMNTCKLLFKVMLQCFLFRASDKGVPHWLLVSRKTQDICKTGCQYRKAFLIQTIKENQYSNHIPHTMQAIILSINNVIWKIYQTNHWKILPSYLCLFHSQPWTGCQYRKAFAMQTIKENQYSALNFPKVALVIS